MCDIRLWYTIIVMASHTSYIISEWVVSSVILLPFILYHYFNLIGKIFAALKPEANRNHNLCLKENEIYFIVENVHNPYLKRVVLPASCIIYTAIVLYRPLRIRRLSSHIGFSRFQRDIKSFDAM